MATDCGWLTERLHIEAAAGSVECPDGSASHPYREGMTWPPDQPTPLTGALVTVDEPGPGRVRGPGFRAR
jgi:hypothetical protein